MPPRRPPAPALPARARILEAAARILTEQGREALTTRTVAAAAGVQAPALYRLFGDKDGLLEAIAEDALTRYVAGKKARPPSPDPLEELRQGWDMNVAFGLENPAVFEILSTHSNPNLSRVAAAGHEVLRARVRRVAAAGLLRVSEELAVDLLRAAGNGTIQVLLATDPTKRDVGLAGLARDAVFAAITTSRPVVREGGVKGAAISLRASLGEATGLSPGERQLLAELLERLSR